MGEIVVSGVGSGRIGTPRVQPFSAKHATRPSIDAIHADAIATTAARDARKAGADTAECASIYAAMYAAAIRGEV